MASDKVGLENQHPYGTDEANGFANETLRAAKDGLGHRQ
jgi:hypothetical protein